MIKFVTDMNKAVKFYCDILGLQLKFESPGWSEFVTGETTLALHPASEKNPAGKVELGFTVADVEAFYRDMTKETGFRRGACPVRRYRRRTIAAWEQRLRRSEQTRCNLCGDPVPPVSRPFFGR